jgi:GAF domain-containing protein
MKQQPTASNILVQLRQLETALRANNNDRALSMVEQITEGLTDANEIDRSPESVAYMGQASREIAGALSERQVYHALFERIKTQKPSEIAVYRFTKIQGTPIWATLRAVWQSEENPTSPVGTKIYLPDSPLKRLFMSVDPLFIEAVDQDSALTKAERESLAIFDPRSVALVPLTFTGDRLGMMVIYFSQPYAFPDHIRQFWLSLADQAGVALNNRSLIQNAAFRAIQTETASEVARAANALLDVNKLLKAAVALIVDRFQVYYAAIHLRDKRGEWIDLRAADGEGKPPADQRVRMDGSTMLGKVLQSRRSRLALDVGQSAPELQTVALPNTRSVLMLPLVYHNQAIGAIEIHSDEQAAFNGEDIIFMRTMADQLANGIENARLFEQAQQEISVRKLTQNRLEIRERYLAAQLEIQNLLLASKASTPPYFEMLKILGEVSQADRVYVFEVNDGSDGQLYASQMAEWCNTNIAPRIDHPDLINFPISERLPRWITILENGNSLNSRTEDLPESEQEILKQHDIQATLVLPVTAEDRFFGFIGFDNCENDQTWDAAEQGLLSTAAAAVSLWHERQQAEEGLLIALQRTESMYRIGNAMVTATERSVTFETLLSEYLRLLHLKSGAGSVLLFEHNRGYTRVASLFVDGRPAATNLSFPANQDQIAARLKETEIPLVVEDVFEHPLTKDSPKYWQQTPEVRSMLFVPLVVHHEVIGAVSIGVPQKNYKFGSSSLEVGQVVTDQLAIWLENRQLLAESQYRSNLLETAAEVSHAASSILDMDELINNSVNLIRDKFNFYYVGLFLADEAKEWAVLRSGTGRAGRIQLARGHRLKIGGESMIGWSVANRQARIALDVGEEAVHFKNPILPDTHSEMALPLLSRDEVLGALTVQSVERGAFSAEDVALLQTMTDQLANAITNARLFENLTEARRQAEERLHHSQVQQQFSQQLATSLDLNEILNAFFSMCITELGFEYIQLALVDRKRQRVKVVGGINVSENQIKLANHPLDSHDIMADIIRTGATEIITGWDDRFNRDLYDQEGHADWVRLFTPVTLRRENIGLVEAGFNKSNRSNITNSQIRLLHAFVTPTALAIENAQRFLASQQAAQREALIKDITTKVRASTELDTILQTTVKELGDAIVNKRAYIQLTGTQLSNGDAGRRQGGAYE